MERMYSVEFSNGRPAIDCPTWQEAYRLAKRALYDIPHGLDDPVITATVTAFQPDGRFGILAEFWIPMPNGAVQRKG